MPPYFPSIWKSFLSFLTLKIWIQTSYFVGYPPICFVWYFLMIQFSSVQSLSRVRLFVTPWIAARQAPRPSPTPRVHSNSHPSSWWCHPAISSSVIPFSSCPQSLPASESFPMSQLFAWGGQSTGVSGSASFLPKNTQGWSPLEWTGWISLQSKGLSRVFSKRFGLYYFGRKTIEVMCLTNCIVSGDT